jgi:hypothetical protein
MHKGRSKLRPIGDTSSFIQKSQETEEALKLDLSKKSISKRRPNVRILKTSNSLSKFPNDFFNSSDNLDNRCSYGQIVKCRNDSNLTQFSKYKYSFD